MNEVKELLAQALPPCDEDEWLIIKAWSSLPRGKFRPLLEGLKTHEVTRKAYTPTEGEALEDRAVVLHGAMNGNQVALRKLQGEGPIYRNNCIAAFLTLQKHFSDREAPFPRKFQGELM